MTVLLAIESLSDLDQTVTVPAEIFNGLWAGNASLAGFAPGESVPLRDLLYGAMLPSGAECCLTLALQVSGSEEAFVDQMNLRAEELGPEHTHFTNCTGLEDPDHYASAADLTHLLDRALENETFRQVFTSRSYTTSPTGAPGDHSTEPYHLLDALEVCKQLRDGTLNA